jgi:tetratricopeptide (TPR) repeat protein
LLLAAAPAAAADPFYEDLLRKGLRDHGRGDFKLAAKRIRIACFGFLEEPPLLTKCLIHLALVQGAAQDREGFSESWERILEIEERFGSYSEVDLPAAKNEFESRALEWISPEELLFSPTFAALLRQQRQDELDSLSPEETRRELETLLASDPENRTLLFRLAELEWDRQKLRRAAQLLDRLLALEPDDQQARCLRGRVAIAPSCTSPPEDADSAASYMACLLKLERFEEAGALLLQLPEELREEKGISGMKARISESESIGERSASDPVAFEGVPAADPQGDTLSTPEEDRADLLRIRDLIDGATTADQLADVLRLAIDLAETHPESQDAQFLAAEAAYRNSQWAEAVHLFRRGGRPPADRAALLFYFAVSLFEDGQHEEAARVLGPALPSLERTVLVDSYAARILGEKETPGDGSL